MGGEGYPADVNASLFESVVFERRAVEAVGVDFAAGHQGDRLSQTFSSGLRA
jgi:hypothetical protein